jgi:hypothetical protein
MKKKEKKKQSWKKKEKNAKIQKKRGKNTVDYL